MIIRIYPVLFDVIDSSATVRIIPDPVDPVISFVSLLCQLLCHLNISLLPATISAIVLLPSCPFRYLATYGVVLRFHTFTML